VLLDIYASFRQQNDASADGEPKTVSTD